MCKPSTFRAPPHVLVKASRTNGDRNSDLIRHHSQQRIQHRFRGSRTALLRRCGPAPQDCSGTTSSWSLSPTGTARIGPGFPGRAPPGHGFSTGAPLCQGSPGVCATGGLGWGAGPADTFRGHPPWGQITKAGPGTANRSRRARQQGPQSPCSAQRGVTGGSPTPVALADRAPGLCCLLPLWG